MAFVTSLLVTWVLWASIYEADSLKLGFQDSYILMCEDCENMSFFCSLLLLQVKNQVNVVKSAR